MTEDMLMGLISSYSSAITCLCFMGGDAEPLEIQRLSLWVRKKFPGIKTAWYSGRQEIPDKFDPKSLDYIKLGPYIEELGGLKSPHTNQALYRIEKDGSFTKIEMN